MRGLQKALQNAPAPPKDLVVWRRTNFAGRLVSKKDNLAKALDDVGDGRKVGDLLKAGQARPGDVIRMDGFQSSSHTFTVTEATMKTDNVLLEIHPK